VSRTLGGRLRVRLRDAGALLRFFRQRRSVGFAILVGVLLVLAVVLYVVQSAAVAPYVYPLF
jgi:hypothetical protein